jgi:hypothetical protein
MSNIKKFLVSWCCQLPWQFSGLLPAFVSVYFIYCGMQKNLSHTFNYFQLRMVKTAYDQNRVTLGLSLLYYARTQPTKHVTTFILYGVLFIH